MYVARAVIRDYENVLAAYNPFSGTASRTQWTSEVEGWLSKRAEDFGKALQAFI